MKCYAHPDRDAVGQCVRCSRGLCYPDAAHWDPPHCAPCAQELRLDRPPSPPPGLGQRLLARASRAPKPYLRFTVISWGIGLVISYFFRILTEAMAATSNQPPLFDEQMFWLVTYVVAAIVAGYIFVAGLPRPPTTTYIGAVTPDEAYGHGILALAGGAIVGFFVLPYYTVLALLGPARWVLHHRTG